MGSVRVRVGGELMKAILFPGQGSQVVGMGRDFVDSFPGCKTLFEKANEVVGYDLTSICFDGPQEELNRSHHAQLGIFVSSVAAYRAMEERGQVGSVDYLAGHSLGEWTALHIAGVVGFEDTLQILQARGSYMQAACEDAPGAMLAVMNVSGEQLIEIAAAAGCFVANFNSLTQTVLSGRVETIEKVEALAKEAGAKRMVRLPVAGAFHSPLMASAAEKMDTFLSSIVFHEPHTPVISNVTGGVHEVKELQARMVEQIISSVRWVACVEFLVSAGVLNCVECGPGKVLAGLIKRIDKNLAVRNIGELADLDG